jgi:two-component system sensor histidine kinase KdpD
VALETVQQGKEVGVECLDEGLHVRVVRGAIKAALANLVENAAEVSPEGQPVLVRVSRDEKRAVIEIVDRGPGLPDEVRRRLFSPHVTTKVGGSGMGLFLARQLVVGMHGGTLEIEDGEGGGTVATVHVPLTESEASVEVTAGD